MAHVPDELVDGQIENAMECQRQLDDAEIRCEVTTVDGARSHEQIAYLATQDVDLLAPQALDVGRRVDALDNHSRVICSRGPMPCAPATTRAASDAARGASRASHIACGQFHGLSIARIGVRQSSEISC